MDAMGITVVAATALAAFLLSALLGKWLIPVLHRLKFGQTIRDVGPAWHKNKQGTPTMGGILFILGMLAALIAAVLVCDLFLPLKIFRVEEGVNQLLLTRLVAGVLMALCCGGIGFMDDYIKVVKKRNLGLTSGQKMFAQWRRGTLYPFIWRAAPPLRCPLWARWISDCGSSPSVCSWWWPPPTPPT